MLIKAGDIINNKAIDVSEGRYWGRIKDVIFIHEERKISGFIIKKDEKKIITLDNVVSIEDQNIAARQINKIPDCKNIEGLRYILQKGKRVISPSGKDIGSFEDICFEIPGGYIVSYKISNGILYDFIKGLRELPPEDVMTIGKDYMVAKDRE